MQTDYNITSGPFEGVTFEATKAAVELCAEETWKGITNPTPDCPIPFYTRLSQFPQVEAATFMEFAVRVELAISALHKREILMDDFEWANYKEKTMSCFTHDLYRYCRVFH